MATNVVKQKSKNRDGRFCALERIWCATESTAYPYCIGCLRPDILWAAYHNVGRQKSDGRLTASTSKRSISTMVAVTVKDEADAAYSVQRQNYIWVLIVRHREMKKRNSSNQDSAEKSLKAGGSAWGSGSLEGLGG